MAIILSEELNLCGDKDITQRPAYFNFNNLGQFGVVLLCTTLHFEWQWNFMLIFTEET